MSQVLFHGLDGEVKIWTAIDMFDLFDPGLLEKLLIG